MEFSLFNPIKEATYLSTSSSRTDKYRPIIRYMYEQHKIFNTIIRPREIYDYLRQFPQFDDYTFAELETDLNQLVSFNNLEEIQDTSDVATIEEFRKNRRLYRCTTYTILLEETIVKMEQNLQHIKGGSLEKTLTDRLLHHLRLLKHQPLGATMTKDELSALNEAWEEVFVRFKQLDENASNYLSHISGDKLEELVKRGEFLAFKKEFVAYLEDFLQALRKNASGIEESILDIDKKREVLIRALVVYRKRNPLNREVDDEVFIQEYEKAWTGLYNWFIQGEQKNSKLGYLYIRTNDAIMKTAKLAGQVIDRLQYTRNRQTEYLHLARIVEELDDLNEAHALFAYMFGFEKIRHLKARIRTSDDQHMSVWDHEPRYETLTFRTGYTGPRATKRALKVQQISPEAQELNRQRELQQRLEETYLRGLIDQGQLVLSEMGTVEPFVRAALLTWIGQAMMNRVSGHVYEGRTEFGVRFILSRNSGEIELQCTDGRLKMPNYVFDFKMKSKRAEGE